MRGIQPLGYFTSIVQWGVVSSATDSAAGLTGAHAEKDKFDMTVYQTKIYQESPPTRVKKAVTNSRCSACGLHHWLDSLEAVL